MPYWMGFRPSGSTRHTSSRASLDLRLSVDDEDPLAIRNNAPKTNRTAAAAKRHDQHSNQNSKPYVSGIEELSSTYGDKDTGSAQLQKEDHDKEKELAELRSENRLLRENNEALADAYRSQESDVRNLNNAVVNADNDLQVTRTQLAACRDELRLCKDDLFRLQPVAQISDTSIEDDFKVVCRQVVGWIDKEMATFERTHPNARPGQFFSPNNDSDIAQIMKNHPDFGEYLVRRSAHSCLMKMLFDKNVYLLGLSFGKKEFLQSAEKTMAKLDPPRDDATIRTWRSETLTALAATNELMAAREMHLGAINEQIHHTISKNFPILAVQSESLARLYDQVTRPAADLADKIHKSSCDYELEMPEHTAIYQEIVPVDALDSFQIIDINSRKTLTPKSVVFWDGHRSIGHALTPVEPALFRVNPGKERTILRQTTLLINLRYPLGKGS